MQSKGFFIFGLIVNLRVNTLIEFSNRIKKVTRDAIVCAHVVGKRECEQAKVAV